MELGGIILSPIAILPISSFTVRTEHLFEEVGEPASVYISVGRPERCMEAAITSVVAAILLLLRLIFICMFPVLAIFIIFLPLLRITQNLVGFINLLKLPMGFRVIRIQVRMIFAGKLFKSLLDVLL